MDYRKLDIEDFDAFVTGHYTHYAIWFDQTFTNFILRYFIPKKGPHQEMFSDFFLTSTSFGTEKKIQLVRKIVKQTQTAKRQKDFDSLLQKLEIFRKDRNKLAHGLLDDNNSSTDPLKISVYISQKDANLEITPEIFESQLDNCEKYLLELKSFLGEIN